LVEQTIRNRPVKSSTLFGGFLSGFYLPSPIYGGAGGCFLSPPNRST
jgi:hypothetical protein